MKKPHIIMDQINDQVDQQADPAEAADQQVDTTDWKAKAIEYETKYKSENGIRRRVEKDLKQYTSKANEPDTQPQDKKGFDYAEKAYLKASGIKPQHFDKVKEVMDSTGKSLEAVLESKYFQAELKETIAQEMAEGATPSGSKRAGNSTRDQVDYWLAKGELPPLDQRELRTKVVNARLKAEQSKSQFTDQPVAGISFK